MWLFLLTIHVCLSQDTLTTALLLHLYGSNICGSRHRFGDETLLFLSSLLTYLCFPRMVSMSMMYFSTSAEETCTKLTHSLTPSLCLYSRLRQIIADMFSRISPSSACINHFDVLTAISCYPPCLCPCRS